MKILIASKNIGKVKEFKKILADFNIEFCTLNEFSSVEEPIETGETLIENALIKAKYYFDLFKVPVIADDTGLFIKGLNYEPGVNTARYSGLGDQGNRQKVLNNLKSDDRSAYFETALIYYDGVNIVSSVGNLFGEISSTEMGNNGFGYDSIFYVPKYNKTLAELDSDVKNSISHRYNAIKGMAFKLAFMFNQISHLDFIRKLIEKVYPDSLLLNVEKLNGGMSNDTYLLEFLDSKKVLRIPGNSADIYVNRKNELKALNKVKGIDTFIQYEYFDLVTGVKISPYLEAEAKTHDFLMLGKTLDELHHLGEYEINYRPFSMLAYYIRVNKIFGVELSREFTALYDKVCSFKKILESRKTYFCHNDNQLSNFIIKDSKYTLIDFEFAGMNDYLFDFACFGNNDLEIGKKALAALENRPITDEENKIIEIWYSVQALNWYLVATFKHVTGMSEQLGLNFEEIATMFLRKAENLLKNY